MKDAAGRDKPGDQTGWVEPLRNPSRRPLRDCDGFRCAQPILPARKYAAASCPAMRPNTNARRTETAFGAVP